MKIHSIQRLCGAAVLTGSLLLASPASRANLVYTVSLDVASLVGNTNGPFSLDLALSSGGQPSNGLNTVTISNFSFTNGSAGATTFSAGTETGSMASTVTLTSSSFDNELSQAFSSGTTRISFSVNETSNTENPALDQFSVAILDGSLSNIATTDPNGGDTLVLSNITSTQTPASVSFYRSTAAGVAPGVVASSAVPEPTSVASLLAGLGALGLGAWKKARRAVAA